MINDKVSSHSIFSHFSLFSPHTKAALQAVSHNKFNEHNMSEPSGDKVTFISIPGAYKTGEHLLVKYEVDANFVTNSRDWVGVFCVGWSSNRDYYTFEWVPSGTVTGDDSKAVHQVKFSGSRLPPEDGHFYQFCYVSRSGVVKGASRPFQFTKTISGDCIGDLDDLVEVSEEDSLLFLRTRHETQLAELHKKVEQLTAVNENVEATVITVKSDCDDQKEKCEKSHSRAAGIPA